MDQLFRSKKAAVLHEIFRLILRKKYTRTKEFPSELKFGSQFSKVGRKESDVVVLLLLSD